MVRSKSIFHRAISVILSTLMIASLFSVPVFAESSAVVTGNSVNVRSGPSTRHSSIGILLNAGHSVTVWEEVADSSGGSVPWYYISFTYNGTVRYGYMRSDFIRIQQSVSPDVPPMEESNFESQLAAFPEDYRPALIALHQQHPNWNFEAYYTDLDWNAVQNLENRLGWSYINDGVISHYSTAPGSYDWATDTYFVREGSNWYQAHPDMVAYFMDPRNFLNETDIFQFELLSFAPSVQTEASIAQMLSGTFMEGKYTTNLAGETVSYARAFLDAANDANVSAFHLVARCIQEVGWNGNSCSSGTYPGYEGYFNFYNIGANSGAADGMRHAKSKGWDTAYKAIYAGGTFIGNNYIARGQNTPYFQKYDVVNKNSVAAHQYMTNVAAARSEGRIQKNKYISLGMLESGFTFSIPVYNNMPSAACAAPAAAGSPNNYLSSLSISGYSLTPTFDFYDTLNNGRTTYALKIQGDVSVVRVNATAVGKNASLSGNLGDVPVSEGMNTLVVTCTAANGAVRNYTINVEVEVPRPPEPVIPEEPEIPVVPETPETPEEPETPDVPLFPENPLPPEERPFGDLDGDGEMNLVDAVYLLFYVNFPEQYPVYQIVDIDGKEGVTMDDAIYFMFHVNFPDIYPLLQKE